MKVYIVVTGGDCVDTIVLKVFKSFEAAEEYVKACIKEDIEEEGYEEEEYQSSMYDLFIKKYALAKNDGEDEIYYEIWEEELG